MAARGPISPRLAWSAEDPDATISISAQPMTAHDFPSFTARILTTLASCLRSTRYSPRTPPSAMTANASANSSFAPGSWRAPATAAIFTPMSGQSDQPENVRALSAGGVLMRRIEAQRDPQQPRTLRMQALARLPVFLDLDGKRAVVAGNGAAVAWKVELLSAAGAEVELFAEHACEELRALAAEAPRGAVTLRQRGWRIKDLAGAAVAVGGF